MIFLCWPEYLMQFLAKRFFGTSTLQSIPVAWGGAWRQAFVQILIYHLISSRRHFFGYGLPHPNPIPRKWGSIHDFLCRSRCFMQFLANKFFCTWPLPHTHPIVEAVGNWLLCRSWHCISFLAKDLFGNCPLTPKSVAKLCSEAHSKPLKVLWSPVAKP